MGRVAIAVIGVWQRVDYNLEACQVFILALTRGLAHQIQKVALALGDFSHVQVHVCLGGTLVRDNIDQLRGGQSLVVSTPSRRAFDRLRKRHLRADNRVTLVLDEADEMLASELKDHIYDLSEVTPTEI